MRLDEYIRHYKKALLTYQKLADQAYVNNTLDEAELHQATVRYHWTGRSYYYVKSIFFTDTIEYPERCGSLPSILLFYQIYHCLTNSICHCIPSSTRRGGGSLLDNVI